MINKTTILLILIITFSKYVFSQCHDWQKDNLIGKVKQVTWINYKKVSTDGIVAKGQLIDYVVVSYDNKGNQTRSEYRNKDFKIDWVYYSNYRNDSLITKGELDSNGNVVWFLDRKHLNDGTIVDKEYKKDSSLNVIYVREFKNSCFPIKESKFKPDSVLKGYVSYKYDDSDRVIEALYEKYWSSGSSSKTTYEYNNDLTQTERYYKAIQDSIPYYVTVKRFSSNKELYEKIKIYSSGESSIATTRFKYDVFSNWIERIVDKTIMNREILYYE